MPPKIKKHGRPKGADKTVIGIPKKRKCSQENKPVPFLKKTRKEKKSYFDVVFLLVYCYFNTSCLVC